MLKLLTTKKHSVTKYGIEIKYSYNKWILTLISVVLITLTFCLIYFNDYLSFKNHECVVLDKHESSDYFLLVLCDENGRVFSTSIDYSFYWKTELGKKYTLSLREFDIKQTFEKNIVWFFCPVLLFSISIGWIVYLLFVIFSNKKYV